MIPMATPTPQREHGLAWLFRQLRWEHTLDALRAEPTEVPKDDRKAA
jgi:hypothetical protein